MTTETLLELYYTLLWKATIPSIKEEQNGTENVLLSMSGDCRL